MMHAFLSGELIRDPERKTASNGNPCVTARVRAGGEIVSVTAFDDELCVRLESLKKGDPLSEGVHRCSSGPKVLKFFT